MRLKFTPDQSAATSAYQATDPVRLELQAAYERIKVLENRAPFPNGIWLHLEEHGRLERAVADLANAKERIVEVEREFARVLAEVKVLRTFSNAVAEAVDDLL